MSSHHDCSIISHFAKERCTLYLALVPLTLQGSSTRRLLYLLRSMTIRHSHAITMPVSLILSLRLSLSLSLMTHFVPGQQHKHKQMSLCPFIQDTNKQIAYTNRHFRSSAFEHKQRPPGLGESRVQNKEEKTVHGCQSKQR